MVLPKIAPRLSEPFESFRANQASTSWCLVPWLPASDYHYRRESRSSLWALVESWKEDQATDRAYRIGQTKEVHVYHLLLHHPGAQERGFDIKLHELVERKRRVALDFLAPADIEVEPASELGALVDEELKVTP